MSWAITTARQTDVGCDEPEEEEAEEEDVYSTSNVDASTFLSCNSVNAEELTNTNGIERIDLSYDYEIHTTTEEDIDISDVSFAVNAFEHDLLKAVADQFDLSSCEFVRRSLRGDDDRRKLGASSVVGAGSYPNDEPDSIYTECIVDVDSIMLTNCTPMKGYMTAWVYGTDRRSLSTSNIYNVIEAYTNNYSNNEGVLAVNYIGDRSEAFVPVISQALQDDGQRDDLVSSSTVMAPGSIAGLSVVSVLALLTFLGAVMANKRKERRDAENEEEAAVSCDDSSVNDSSLVMIEEDDEEIMKDGDVSDDTSKFSDASDDSTEVHTVAESFAPSATFESEDPRDDTGFEVTI